MNLTKTVFIFLIVFMVAVGCRDGVNNVEPNSNREQIKRHVEERFKRMMDAAFNKDVVRYFSFVDMNAYVGLDDYGGIIDSGLQLEKAFRRNTDLISRYKSFDFNKIIVKVISNECVIVIAKVRADVEITHGKQLVFNGGYSQLWHKVKGQWKVISSSSLLSPVNIQ